MYYSFVYIDSKIQIEERWWSVSVKTLVLGEANLPMAEEYHALGLACRGELVSWRL